MEEFNKNDKNTKTMDGKHSNNEIVSGRKKVIIKNENKNKLFFFTLQDLILHFLSSSALRVRLEDPNKWFKW